MREFAVSFDNTTISVYSFICVFPTAAPNMNLEFLRYWMGQAANATSAQARIQLVTQASSWPTTYTSATVTGLKVGDPNASVLTGFSSPSLTNPATVGIAPNTTLSDGAGTKTFRWNDAFNVLNGWLHVPTPPETRVMPSGYTSTFQMYLPSPTNLTLTGWSAGLCFREV